MFIFYLYIQHPGGAAIILKFGGTDVSYAWNMNHEKNFIGKYVPGLVLGTAVGASADILDNLNVTLAVGQEQGASVCLFHP